MSQRTVTISKRAFGEDLTDEQIAHWQALGPEAIFRAVYELSLLGYLMQGVDTRKLRMDRNRFERRVVPWSSTASFADDDA